MTKKSIIPTYSSLLILALVQLWNISRDFSDDPLNFLLSNAALFTFFFILILASQCVYSLSSYLLWYYKAKHQAKIDGSSLKTKSHRTFQTVIFFISICGLLLFLLQTAFSSGKNLIITILVVFFYILSILVTLLTKHILHNKGVSAEQNRKLTSIVGITSIFFMTMAFIVLITNGFLESGSSSNSSARHRRESIFLIQWAGTEITDDIEADYKTTHIKIPAMYDYVFDRIYFKYELDFYKENYPGLTYRYEEMDSDKFDANRTYKLTVNYLDGRSKESYLFCYKDRIIELDTHGMELDSKLVRDLKGK